MTMSMRTAVIGLVGGLGLLAGSGVASAQELSREGATLGALLGRAGAVVEGVVRSVGETQDGSVIATVDVRRTLAGDAGPVIAVKTTAGRSDSVEIARGETSLFILAAGGGETNGPAAEAVGNLPVHELEGVWLGRIEIGSAEGNALIAQIEGYLRTAGSVPARQAFLAQALSHWSPRLATDAAVDLLATAGAFDAHTTAAIVDALERNRETFLDIRPVVELAGRTGDRSAVGPLLDTLEMANVDFAIPAIAAALDRTARGTNLVPVLVSTLERHASLGLRAKAAAVLGEMREPAAASALAAAAGHANAGVRRAAIKALGEVGGSAAIAALDRKLTSTSAPAADRRAAAVALAAAGRAGALVLAAREGVVGPEMRPFVALVRDNPAAAQAAVAGE